MIFWIVLLFGLLVGSFLNVCIARLPLGQSLIRPASHCPRCKTPIRWYDNVPIISFLLLGGKCRSCRLPISLRYPLVELLNGFLYLGALSVYGLTGEGVLVMVLCSSLLVITFIDLDHQIIPDVITLPGVVFGLAVAPFFMTALAAPVPFGLAPDAGVYLTGLLNSVIGLLMGGGPLLLIGWLWEKLRGVEAMGGGDVKLMGMMGSFLGWRGAVMTIMLGAFAGTIVGMALILLKKHRAEQQIPFGPFLAAGALITLFYGDDLTAWYFGMLSP
jgi:leader peptidase (prepilin peptidase)/N-methyltransferase